MATVPKKILAYADYKGLSNPGVFDWIESITSSRICS